MNWHKQINKILGFFWLNVWRDSWLTDLLGKFLHFIVGRNLFDKVQNIQKQAACTSLQTTDNIRYIPVYIESNSAAAYAWVSKNDTQFNQSNLTIDKLLYTKCPDWLQLSVSDTSYKLLPGYDFDWEAGTIKIRRSVTQKITQNIIWAVYDSYTAVLDRFTEIMGLPAQWVYKYPGAVQAAWSIKQNGANQRDVVALLSAIGGSGLWCGQQGSPEPDPTIPDPNCSDSLVVFLGSLDGEDPRLNYEADPCVKYIIYARVPDNVADLVEIGYGDSYYHWEGCGCNPFKLYCAYDADSARFTVLRMVTRKQTYTDPETGETMEWEDYLDPIYDCCDYGDGVGNQHVDINAAITNTNGNKELYIAGHKGPALSASYPLAAGSYRTWFRVDQAHQYGPDTWLYYPVDVIVESLK